MKDENGKIFVTVIVPCYQEIRYIRGCLDSLLNQKYGKEHYEVIVVDGMSTDGTRNIIQEYVKKLDIVKFVDNERRYAAPGLNLGISQAKGDIIIRADAHSEYADDYIEQCVNTLIETKADNVGGPALTKWKGYLQRVIAAAYGSVFAVGNASFHFCDYEGEVDTVTYGCWWKKKLQECGGFDEGFVKNQDDELNIRIKSHGGRIWLSPKIRSWYYPQSSLIGLFKQYFRYGFWKYRVFQKHKNMRRLRHIIPSTFLLALVFTGVAWSVGYLYAYSWSSKWWNTIILYIGFIFVLYSTTRYAIAHKYRKALMVMHIGLGIIGLILIMSGVLILGIGVGKLSWLFVVTLYLLFLFYGSWHITLKNGMSLIILMPLVIASFHIAYGLGFICGTFYWSIIKRAGRVERELIENA